MKKHKRSRTSILRGAIILAFGLVVVRLFWLQIIQGEKYREMADNSLIKQREIKASRGLIYAMNGSTPTKLVINETVYTLFVDPQDYKKDQKEEIILTLRQIAGGNLVNNFEDLFEKDNRYQILARNLTRKQADSIREKRFRGIGFTEDTRRVYPEGQLASQILGFVNAEGGKYGIEEVFNDELSGKSGILKATTDINGKKLLIGKNDIEIPAENGKNLVLSIDRNIQSKVEKTLEQKLKDFGFSNGSVLVINPENGKVMAMANYPTFDPAKFSEVQDVAQFNNSTTTMAFENGSVIKPLTMAMGINEGVVNASSTYYNNDRIQVGDRTISNLVRGYTGQISFQTAMTYSLNTGMVEILNRIGGGSISKEARDKVYDYFYNRFGLAQRTGIEIPEARGVIISPEQVEGNAVRYSNMSFGQGMDTTMIQTISAFSSIINGGTLYKPSVIAGEITEEGEFIKKEPEVRNENVISSQASAEIRDILVTGRISVQSSLEIPGYKVGGKTGTSQTLVNGKYVDNQTIGSYLGFGGNNSPKFVIMVAVWGEGQNPQGHLHAQPIFNEISNWMLNYLKIKPEE